MGSSALIGIEVVETYLYPPLFATQKMNVRWGFVCTDF